MLKAVESLWKVYEKSGVAPRQDSARHQSEQEIKDRLLEAEDDGFFAFKTAVAAGMASSAFYHSLPPPTTTTTTTTTTTGYASLAPPTPPMTGGFTRRTIAQHDLPPSPLPSSTALPSIAQFDRQISRQKDWRMGLVTPPDDEQPQYPHDEPIFTSEVPIDWRETRSARFIAEKTCEMICYLWFANSSSSRRRPTNLQLLATPTFVHFMQKLLETTQVSHSVIVLSLHYIWRLKDRNDRLERCAGEEAQPGSEFRIAVASLMMANKFLDDNTYTNRTWSDVSGISLSEINRMEREFLLGVDFNLYVDKRTYEKWLWMLKGLVLAKEKEKGALTARRRVERKRPATPRDAGRARSTSPHRTLPPPLATHLPPLTIAVKPAKPGKRTADTAFSPTSATFQREVKRVHQSLPRIQTSGYYTGKTREPSPLEGFSRMSLSSPAETCKAETLASAYSCQKKEHVPESLYFYTLAGSTDDGRRQRLRYTTTNPYPPSFPTSKLPAWTTTRPTQSASTSPMHLDISLPVPSFNRVELPPLHHPQPMRKVQVNTLAHEYTSRAPAVYPLTAPGHPYPTYSQSPSPTRAQFANAGPPGVAFYQGYWYPHR